MNDMLDDRIFDRLGRFFKKFKARNILKTTEEVEANTNEDNLPSAVVVSELINKLGGIEFIFDEDGKIVGYKSKAGADAVFPFSASGTLKVNFSFKAALRYYNVSDSALDPVLCSGSLIVAIEGGKVKSSSISGYGSLYTLGGVSVCTGCLINGFAITSVTWTPD